MGKNTQIRIFESNNNSAILLKTIIQLIDQLSGDSNVNAKADEKIIDFSIFIRFRSVASFIYYFLM